MRNFLLLFGLGFFVFSCSTIRSKSDKNTSEETQKIMIPQSNCFAFLTDQDSIWLKVEVFPNVVTGVLKYQLSGKDKNEGTLEGKLEGNILYADYTFSSEGKKSVREVAFLLKNDMAMEGFGAIEEKNGKFVFKNRSNIDFTKGIKYVQVNCADNDGQFQIK